MKLHPAVSLALRIVVSVGMIAVLLWQAPDFTVGELVPEPSSSTFVWLGIAGALTLAGMVLATVRWKQVLTALGLPSEMGRLFSLTMAGQFVSNVLPTTIGGDVLRVSRLSKDTGRSPDTFASVVLERVTGWLVLPVITLFGLAVNPGLRHLGTATVVAAGLALATLSLLAGTLFAVSSDRFGTRFAVRDGWRRFAGAIHLGLVRMRAHPRSAVGVLLAGFAYQFVLVLSAWPPPAPSACSRQASRRCSRSSRPCSSSRCCRSASRGWGSGRAHSSCSSDRSAWRPRTPSRSASSCTCST